MDDRRITVIYQEYVVVHDLERSALLEALRARCAGEATVLYPGAFVHVTPSFFFQHVVYVDRSDFSRDFFGRAQAVLDVVNRHKRYRQRPFIRFLEQDFTADLPVPEGSFDLLLALYAGGTTLTISAPVERGAVPCAESAAGLAFWPRATHCKGEMHAPGCGLSATRPEGYDPPCRNNLAGLVRFFDGR